MPLEVNEMGIMMRVVDRPEQPVQLQERGGRSEKQLIDECVRRVLEALKREQER